MKYNYLVCLFLFFIKVSFAQVTLYQENFDSYAGSSGKLSASTFSGWSNYSVLGTTNNEWFILNATTPNCNSISGNYSIGVSKNTLNVANPMPAATITNAHEHVAYYTTPINATAYTSLTLDFKWLGSGSGANAFGKVCYSLNGTTWTDFPTSGTYNGQTATQTVTNLSLAAVNGQSFYLGFRWKNLVSTGTMLSFQIDDIVVKGTFVPPTNNDNCVGAIAVPVNAGTTCTLTGAGDSNIAGVTQSLATCATGANADDDVWYKFTASSYEHIVTVTPGTMSNVVFEVFQGNCSALTSIACVNATTGTNAETTKLKCLAPGSEYFMRVYSNGAGGKGTFTICITTPAITFNDEVYQAVSLTVNGATCTTSTAGTTVGATDSGVAENCSGGESPDDDVWYSFIATNEVHDVRITDGAITNITAEVFTGDCINLSWIGCSNRSGGNDDEFFQVSDLIPGTKYYIRVYSAGTSSGQGAFSVCVTTPATPANSECSGAIGLTVNPSTTCVSTTTGTTIGATSSLDEISPCYGFTSEKNHGDVWYSFVATSTWHDISVDPLTMLDVAIDLRVGTCGASVNLDCANSSNFQIIETIHAGGLVPGQTYFVRVYSAQFNDPGTFRICVTTPCAPGNGAGTTDLAYPEVVTGELGTGGADATIPCGAASAVTLEAAFTPIKATTTYTVNKLSGFTPPYQFNCLANKVKINTEDHFSDVINLPFPVCFYGQTYNQIVVGTNGVVSFKTSLANTYSGFLIRTNIPNAANCYDDNGTSTIADDVPIGYGAAIMGAFTDIVDKNSAQIGWEEITLDNGGQAMVIGFSDSYMYNDTAAPYTSMIVIHKDTNIIDVYVKDKTLTTTMAGLNLHNENRGIIGLQDATSTQAVFPAGYNGLSAPWTATNEAWRFTPNGALLSPTVSWYEGSGTAGTFLGNGATIVVNPTTTTTYTAAVEYTTCGTNTFVVLDETIVNADSGTVWNGSVSSDWNNTANWTPNVLPTLSDCVLIPVTPNNPIISGSGYNGLAGNVTIENGAVLTITSGNNLTVTDWVNVNASANLYVNNTANLVQINNVLNSGNITVYRDVNIKKFDYVYWSSPVSPFGSSAISPGTNPYYIWKWTPTIGSNLNGYGNWTNGNESMTLGKGYIVRGPDAFNNTATQLFTSTFNGVANNGTISVPITRGAYVGSNYTTASGTATQNDDNWNLLGNPYPSSIRAIDFLTTNNNIAGFIKIWTHGTLPSNTISDPFYNDFVYNYTTDDYITYNVTGVSEGPGVFNGFINSGQGFFTLMLDAGAASQNIVFNNTMRSATYANNQFFRTASTSSETFEESRLWLDLVAPSLKQTRTLIGYVNNATNDSDRLYDAITDEKAAFKLYSLLNNEKLTIQGRALPFDKYDKVPVGVNINQTGEYVFSIGALEGFLSDNQYQIYIEDKELQIVHDLKISPYRFNVNNLNNSSIENRFEIKYLNTTLGNNDFLLDNSVQIVSTDVISVLSNNEIKKVNVWNVLGQLLYENKSINNREIIITKIYKNNAPLIIEVELLNGAKVKKKIIF